MARVPTYVIKRVGTLSRMQTVIMVAVLLCFVAFLASVANSARKDNEYRRLCRDMGGVAVIGSEGRHCFWTGSVIVLD